MPMLTSILSHFFLFHFSIEIIQWLLKVIYSYVILLKLTKRKTKNSESYCL